MSADSSTPLLQKLFSPAQLQNDLPRIEAIFYTSIPFHFTKSPRGVSLAATWHDLESHGGLFSASGLIASRTFFFVTEALQLQVTVVNFADSSKCFTVSGIIFRHESTFCRGGGSVTLAICSSRSQDVLPDEIELVEAAIFSLPSGHTQYESCKHPRAKKVSFASPQPYSYWKVALPRHRRSSLDFIVTRSILE